MATSDHGAARSAGEPADPKQKDPAGGHAEMSPTRREAPGLRRGTDNQHRLKGLPGEANCHHVMSRLSDGLPMWDELEKEALVRMLVKLAAFCGVEILTYCVMGSHFHALVRVPDRSLWLQRFSSPDADDAFFQHLETLYSKAYVSRLQRAFQGLRNKGREEEAARVLAAYQRRFCDVSIWVKEVKERFARWFNRQRVRRGSMWSDRFRSILVQDGEVMRAMAVYIDLNPLRAGVVSAPAHYRWSGFGAAMTGNLTEQTALAKVVGTEDLPWEAVRETYQEWLRTAIGDGRKGAADAGEGLPEEILERVFRGMGGGGLLGTEDWATSVFRQNKKLLGEKWKPDTRPRRRRRQD